MIIHPIDLEIPDYFCLSTLKHPITMINYVAPGYFQLIVMLNAPDWSGIIGRNGVYPWEISMGVPGLARDSNKIPADEVESKFSTSVSW